MKKALLNGVLSRAELFVLAAYGLFTQDLWGSVLKNSLTQVGAVKLALMSVVLLFFWGFALYVTVKLEDMDDGTSSNSGDHPRDCGACNNGRRASAGQKARKKKR